MKKLHDKPRNVVITGASSGIGRALAEVFAKQGDMVIALARSKTRLKSLKKRILSEKGECEAFICDLRQYGQVISTARKIRKKHKQIDVIINNAGITYFKDFSRTNVKEFDNIVLTNLRGSFLITKEFLGGFLKRKSGLIINILSYAAKTTYRSSSAYSASKSGVEALMNGLREEVREKGIKVMNVYPGAVLTPMWPAKLIHKLRKHTIDPVEVASLVYLASRQPENLMVEELVVRPKEGDLRI